MSERYIRYYDSNSGTTTTSTFSFDKSKKYKLNKSSGAIEEVTAQNALADDEISIPGSKSSLRRIGDLERNISILASKAGVSGISNTDTETLLKTGGSISGNFSVSGSSTLGTTSVGALTASGITVSGDVTINGGDIILGGTGRIQGIDTVSASTDAANKGYVDTAVSNLVNAAPAALNTLDELAAALGDDANFATTVTNSIATKVSTGSAEYLKNATVSNDTITFTKGDGATFAISISDANTWRGVTDSTSTVDSTISASATAVKAAYDLAAAALPATGKAADSNLLDGLDSTVFARSNADDTLTGVITFSNTTASTSSTTGAVKIAGGLGVGGAIVAAGDVTAYSDDSLKTNVQVIDGALGKVDQIRGVTFERINDGSVSVGVIAQELEAVLPEAVKMDENGIRHVAYGNITGLLIEAIKELKAEVESLKK